MHEMITVQFGREANYTGTHFWNAQNTYQTYDAAEESNNNSEAAKGPDDLPLDHDILYRPGRAADGSETYLPRVLIYDLKRGFGSLARVNVLGDVDEMGEVGGESELWNGPLKRLQTSAQVQPSPYALSLMASEAPVAPTPATTPFFSDFASTYFHTRSLIPLSPPYPQLETSTAKAPANANLALPEFASFADGGRLFTSHDALTEIFDSEIRPWIEETDALQAMQLFTSLSDAWAGFSASYLEALRDELPKTCLWVWAIEIVQDAPHGIKARWERAINRARAVAAIAGSASMLVPVTVPGVLPETVHIQRESLWHRSALLCAGIESITLPTRVKGSMRPTLGEWEALLCDSGRRRIASLQYGILREDKDEQSPEKRDRRITGTDEDPRALEKEMNSDLTIDLFPHDIGGADRKNGRRLGGRTKTFSRIDCYRSSLHSSLQFLDTKSHDHQYRALNGPITRQYTSVPGLPLPLTFPRIFTKQARAATTTRLPIHSSLQTNTGMADWLRRLAVPLGHGTSLTLPVELPDEEREELRSTLSGMAEGYVEDWESDGSDDENMDDGD